MTEHLIIEQQELQMSGEMNNLKSFMVQQCDATNRWFIVAGDMFEHDARYWLARYRELYPDKIFRIRQLISAE